MKQHSIFFLLIFLWVAVFNCFSQKTKTPLFKAYPSLVKCPVPELDKAFSEKSTKDIELIFSDEFKIKGTVISNSIRYQNLYSVVIKLPNFNNAVCYLAKKINADNSVSYSGRIINPLSEDCYMLKKDAANSYQLIKMNLEDLMPTCSMF